MTLWKRGRVWWTYVSIDGVRHAKSTETGNLKFAQKVDQQFKEDLTNARLGMQVPQPEMTFGELATRFIAEASPKAWHLDRLKVLLPYWNEVAIGHISKGLVRDYRGHRHAEKHISDTTVNRDLEALRHLLYWAVDEGFLTANPLRRMPLVHERRKPRMVMTVAEEARLLEAAGPHLRPIIIAALDTGMRRGEILSQKWEHVDLSRNLLFVTHSKTAGGEGREVPLTRRLRSLLAAMTPSQELVFTFRGQPIHAVKTAWKATICRAGIRYYRFHDLRHTFNTRLMEAGVMQEIRKALMGHSSGEEVNSIYTHVELPAKREAIRKLEEWVATQQLQLQTQPQGGAHDSAKSSRGSSRKVLGFPNRKEAVEKEDPGRSRA